MVDTPFRQDLTDEEKAVLDWRLSESFLSGIEQDHRALCNAGAWQDLQVDGAEVGRNEPAARDFCPELMLEILNEDMAHPDFATRQLYGFMEPYELDALDRRMVLDSAPTGGERRGAALHWLQLLHKSFAEPSNREAVSGPGLAVEGTVVGTGDREWLPVVAGREPNSPVLIGQSQAFEVGFATRLTLLADPAPDVYFAFDPGMPGSGEPVVPLPHLVTRTPQELLDLAISGACYEPTEENSILECGAAGEVLAYAFLNTPMPAPLPVTQDDVRAPSDLPDARPTPAARAASGS